MSEPDFENTPVQYGTARGTLKEIAKMYPLKLTGTLSLVALENILHTLYPVFAGIAIDAILQKNLAKASVYAAIVLAFWVVGAARRSADTRIFARIYARLAIKVIASQRARQHDYSTITARVVLARGFIDFFEQHFPVFITSVIAIIGSAAMLLFIEPWLGAACVSVLVLFSFFLPRYARKNQELYHRLNNRMEKEVDCIAQSGTSALTRHYQVLTLLRIRLSDREAWSYLVIGITASLLFLLAITRLVAAPEVSAGHVYAVMTYLWNFASSLDEGPLLVDNFAKLRDIGRRVAT